MDEQIDFPVTVNGETVHVTAKVLSFGYTYKLSIMVNELEVLFEPDEQRTYRAILADPAKVPSKADISMIGAIADTLNGMS
jgi:hypothetical protein